MHLKLIIHLNPFLRNFFVLYEKLVRDTPGWNNSSFQDLVIDFQRLFYINHEFENWTFVWVRLILFFLVSLILFDCRTQSNSMHELGSIEFDLGSIGIWFHWVRVTVPDLINLIWPRWAFSCKTIEVRSTRYVLYLLELYKEIEFYSLAKPVLLISLVNHCGL